MIIQACASGYFEWPDVIIVAILASLTAFAMYFGRRP